MPRKSVKAWEKQFLTFMHERMPEVRSELVEKKEITADFDKKLRDAIAAFNKTFKA